MRERPKILKPMPDRSEKLPRQYSTMTGIEFLEQHKIKNAQDELAKLWGDLKFQTQEGTKFDNIHLYDTLHKMQTTLVYLRTIEKVVADLKEWDDVDSAQEDNT